MASKYYNDQVFINCPFDKDYLNLYRACIFTVLDAGFIPRCSKEVENATVFRLGTIVNIIRDCKFGIHDLSRVELDSQSRLPRFNMPFEFGIFYSAKQFGNSSQNRKECIVLERQNYRYQKFISDIAGIDVSAHKNNQKKLINAVRNWLVTASRRTTIPSGTVIYNRYNTFQSGMRRACRQQSIDYDAMPFIELVSNITDWLNINQNDHIQIFSP